MKKFIIIICLFVMLICGCSNSKSENNFNNDGTITYLYAKELIINNGAILLDIDSNDDYTKNHIDGSINLYFNDINSDNTSQNIADKNSIIIIYSKDGKNNKSAIQKLNDLEYNNVYNLGTTDNWK